MGGTAFPCGSGAVSLLRVDAGSADSVGLVSDSAPRPRRSRMTKPRSSSAMVTSCGTHKNTIAPEWYSSRLRALPNQSLFSYNSEFGGATMSAQFDEVVKIMATLRDEGGCPWDRKQTPQSLAPYLIEEAYEVLETIDAQDDSKLKEELGDVLLQVLFHAQIGRERQTFTIEDVLRTLADKLVRRHPHVFVETTVKDAAFVLPPIESNSCRPHLELIGSQKRGESFRHSV